MNVLFPGLSSDEIAVKVMQRAAILRKVAMNDGEDRERDYRAFRDQYRQRPEIAAMLNNPAFTGLGVDITEQLDSIVRPQFLYAPGAEFLASQAALRTAAYDIIPENIKTERWSKHVCDCVLHAAYDKNNHAASIQTFDLQPCASHAGLTMEKNHDAVHGEMSRYGAVYRTLLGIDTPELNLGLSIAADASPNAALKFKDGVDWSPSWSGTGKDRVLHVEIVGAVLPDARKNALRTNMNALYGAGKVVIA
jgi:hypothetical protein